MKKMIGIDLFAGAGGMSIGATLAGVEVKLAIEIDKYAALTYSINHKNTHVYNSDIRNLSDRDILKVRKQGRPSIVFGGPPCQGFSYSNQRTRGKKNKENYLYTEFIRVVSTWSPDWVVFENVKGITDTEGGIFLKRVINDLNVLGYSTNYGILNAFDFGIPQNRNRLFLVGRKGRIIPHMPIARRQDRTTVQDALHDLPLLENGSSHSTLSYRSLAKSNYAKQLRGSLTRCSNHLVTKNSQLVIERFGHVPQGGNWENIPTRLMKNYKDRSRCHTGIYHRLELRRPSIVIGNYRKNMLIHPNQSRGLSVREAARLQSFPDNYEFFGSIGFQQQQVGNAVPPLLARAVFQEVVAQEGKL